jgi:hypothetical protein
VSDGAVTSDPVSISITATNQAPVAMDDAASTQPGIGVDMDVPGNDSDADGDPLSIASVVQPSNGIVSINGRSLHYVPAAGFNGTDVFEYAATDGAGSDTAAVTVVVGETPLPNAIPTAVLRVVPATLDVGSVATLDFAGSFDPDAADAIANYSVTLTAAPVGSAGGAVGGQRFVVGTPFDTLLTTLTFVPDVEGFYRFQLAVSDTRGASSAPVSAELGASVAAGLQLQGVPGQLRLGQVATATIHLPAPAGPGGAHVDLVSDSPSIVDLPASVTVFAGETDAFFNVSAIAVGAATVTASAAGTTSATKAIAVMPVLLGLSASSGDVPLMLGDTSTLTVTLRDPAPATGTTVLLSVSDASRATLASHSITIPAGSAKASTTLTAAAIGSVVVSAASTGPAASASLRLSVVPLAASRTLTSDGLIDAALQSGEITSEQALLYRLLAAFGSPDLPPQYLGNSFGILDSSVSRGAAHRFPSLTAPVQEAILPYLFPPTYSGSWGTLFDGPAARVGARALESTTDRSSPCLASFPTVVSATGVG